MKKQLLITVLLFICSFINAQNQCNADSMYYYNSTNKVIQKYFYTYSINGLQTENLLKDSLNGIWVNNSRTQQTFNANDKVTQQLSQQWKNNTWRNTVRYLYSYDLNNNLLTNVPQLWDTLNSSWILNGFIQSYVYDINNNNIKRVQSYWNIGVVSDSIKFTMTYNANGNELTNLTENWTTSNPMWRNGQLSSNSYNTNNQKDSTYKIIWNVTNSSWDTSYLDTYTYNTAGNLIELINHNRIWPNWGNSIKYTYTFDSNNNRTSQNRFTWDQTSSSWSPNVERTDVYNTNNLVTYSLTKNYNSTVGGVVNAYQANYTYDSNDKLILVIYDNWDITNSAWLLSSKYRYFHNCGSLSGIDEISNNYLNLYPNPTSTILNIEVKEQTQISIVNVLGDVVLTQTINGLSKIDVSNLTSGVYFIQDSKSGKAIKFIKE